MGVEDLRDEGKRKDQRDKLDEVVERGEWEEEAGLMDWHQCGVRGDGTEEETRS